MKRKLNLTVAALIFITALSSGLCQAQKMDTTKALRANADTSWVINSLVAPSSAGASLIGISPSVIQKPTDPSAFTVSLLNATNNLTAIPNSYAVDFAPAWLFYGQHISYNQFKSNALGNNIWQSLDVSFALKNVKDTVSDKTNTTLGLGLKFSLLRGAISKKANSLVDQSYELLSQLTAAQTAKIKAYGKSHPEYLAGVKSATRITDTALKTQVITRLERTRDSVYKLASVEQKDKLDSIKKIGEAISFARYGWKLDFAGGLSYYFPGQVYSTGTLNNAGAWLTGGYEDEDSRVSVLEIARYLYNPKEAYADPANILKNSNLSTFDFGLRMLFGTKDTKFTFGGEVIYRSIVNNNAVPSSYRYSLNADYQVGKNQLISFTFGRDFDRIVTKGGNLLAALNFVMGFGNTKSIKPN
jgi:hypothetical protein